MVAPVVPVQAAGDAAKPHPAATLVSPPTVVRGAKSQSAQLWDEAVSVDWLRVSFKREGLAQVRDIWRSFFGEGEPGRGRFNLADGERYGSGSGLYFDENEFYCIAEASGELLRSIPPGHVYGLLQRLVEAGCTVKRLDLAVDVFAERCNLLDCVRASCEGGELVGARSYRISEERSGPLVVGSTIYMGRRGADGSGRFVRVYDKGLEQGGSLPREWIRWEAELSDDVATSAAVSISLAPDVRAEVRRIAVGAVEFRKVTGRREMSRRPHVAWYADFSRGDVRMIRGVRVETSLDSWAEWVRSAVAPSLGTFSSMLHKSVPEFLDWLGADLSPVERCQKTDVGRHVRRIASGGEVVFSDLDRAAEVAAESMRRHEVPPSLE